MKHPNYSRLSPLYEMGYNQKNFKEDVNSNKTREIIRNYALVYYASKHQLDYIINHWRGEFITLITDFQDMETKPKKGNRQMVYNVIYKVWIDQMELNKRPLTIIHKFIAKFKDENIFCSDDELMEIAESFISNIDTIMREMAFGDYETTYNFINSI